MIWSERNTLVNRHTTYIKFEYQKKGIKEIIINKRKMELLDKTYKDIYTEGLKRNNAEYINKEQ